MRMIVCKFVYDEILKRCVIMMTGFYVSLAIGLCIWIVILFMVIRLPSPFKQKYRSKESDKNRMIAQISGEIVLGSAAGIEVMCLMMILFKNSLRLPNFGFMISSLLFVLFLIEIISLFAFSKYYMNHRYLHERESWLDSIN